MSEFGSGGSVSGALSPRVRAVLTVGLVGALAGFLWGVADVPRYSATATVVVAGEGGGPPDPAEVSRFAELGSGSTVGTQAAGLLGGDVAGADLLSDVVVRPAARSGTIIVQASADSPDFAVAAANGFAEALVDVGGKPLEPGAAATLPDGPSENRSAPLWSAIGLALGLLAGALALLVSSRRGAGAMEVPREAAAIPAGAEGSSVPAAEAFGAAGVLVSFDDPRDLIHRRNGALRLGRSGDQSMSTLAHRLSLDDADAPRTLAILEVAAGDGARFVLLGLAIAAGELGLRVLVVEADLSRPALAGLAGVAPSPGLRDYLWGTAGPRDVLRSVGAANDDGPVPLACVPAGDVGGEASPGIAGPRFDGLVERLPRVYDLVIFSGPPASLAGDADALARAVEGLVLVAADEDGAGTRIAASAASLPPGKLLGGVLTRPLPAQAVPQGRFR